MDTVMTYETKDSGERQEFDSGMVRDVDAGKPRFDLLLPKGLPFGEQMLTRWAMLMERGRSKYGERNWEKANGQAELDRAVGSALRHMMQWVNGMEDEDHAAAIMFNVAEAEFVKFKMYQSENPPKILEADMADVKDFKECGHAACMNHEHPGCCRDYE
jgi:hypothetical protein